MIELRGLSKRYGTLRDPVHALRDVTLSMGPGVWAVVGPNGAGKTTLLGLLLGFLRPSDGSVRIDGDPPDRHRRRRGAAYLPERFRLPGAWPVRAALLSLARLDGLDRADARRAVDETLDRLGLAGHADRPVDRLSRGLLQRVGLAQTLLADRALVVLDEPTEGLDPLWRVRFRELVDGLRAGGRTVILASHDLSEVERLADRVVILYDGRVTDVVDARPPGGPLRYRLATAAGAEVVRSAFPDAAAADPGPDGENAWVVVVGDERELSDRLAAFLEAGGVVGELARAGGDLEARVRERLEEG